MGQFNIRVYGILLNDKEEVLVSDELIKNMRITKFPGGGLEFGEGMIDCVKREFMEEINLPIEVVEHFYTTDFFQSSAFHKDHQVISVYYIVKSLSASDISITDKVVNFNQQAEDAQNFRWINRRKISAEDFTLPIDKIVGRMLQKKFGGN